MTPEEAQELVTQMTDEMERAQTTLTLLYEIVERTGHYQAGFRALRNINDLTHTVVMALPDPEYYLQQLRNMTATILAECDRLDGATA